MGTLSKFGEKCVVLCFPCPIVILHRTENPSRSDWARWTLATRKSINGVHQYIQNRVAAMHLYGSDLYEREVTTQLGAPACTGWRLVRSSMLVGHAFRRGHGLSEKKSGQTIMYTYSTLTQISPSHIQNHQVWGGPLAARPRNPPDRFICIIGIGMPPLPMAPGIFTLGIHMPMAPIPIICGFMGMLAPPMLCMPARWPWPPIMPPVPAPTVVRFPKITLVKISRKRNIKLGFHYSSEATIRH